jgi:dimethylargininase
MKRLNFRHAIARKPCKNLADGLTSASQGLPDFELARAQHRRYCDTLRKCGLEVSLLDSETDFPDSTFVEDVALLTPACCILTRPGALTRRGEVALIRPALEQLDRPIESVEPPGTLDAGDVMQVGSHFYIGLSSRSNREGIRQVLAILRQYGMEGSVVPLAAGLHLKSSIAYLEENRLLLTSELAAHPGFAGFEHILVAPGEEQAANSLWVNGTVLVPKGFPQTTEQVNNAGLEVIGLDVSEFRKQDGGLSCLSLRY